MKRSINFSTDITEVTLHTLDDIIRTCDSPFIIKKRLLDITLELSQNILKHTVPYFSKDSRVIINKKADHYSITSVNAIHRKSVNQLLNTIAHINSLDRRRLREFHTKSLKNSILSEKGGAGLGLIRIAMRSVSKLKCSIGQLNGSVCLFSLRVNISTQA